MSGHQPGFKFDGQQPGPYPPPQATYPPQQVQYPPPNSQQGYYLPQQPNVPYASSGYNHQPFPAPIQHQPPYVNSVQSSWANSNFKTYLLGATSFHAKQKVELLEALVGWETSNKYTVKDQLGNKVFYVGEQSDCFGRQFCANSRAFTLVAKDRLGLDVLRFERPIDCSCCCGACCKNSIVVSTADGQILGSLIEEFSIIYPRFKIKDATGRTVLKIEGPLCTCSFNCGPVIFKVMTREGVTVGTISKEWGGLVREYFTDADYFSMSFPADLDCAIKAVCLAALFMIEFKYFEHTRSFAGEHAALLAVLALISINKEAESASVGDYMNGAKDYLVTLVKDGFISKSAVATAFSESMSNIKERYEQAKLNGELNGKDEADKSAYYYRLVIDEIHKLKEKIGANNSDAPMEGSESNQDKFMATINKFETNAKMRMPPQFDMMDMQMDMNDDDDEGELELRNELDNLDLEKRGTEMGWGLNAENQAALKSRTLEVLGNLVQNELKTLAMIIVSSYLGGPAAGAMGPALAAARYGIKSKLIEFFMQSVMDMFAGLLGQKINPQMQNPLVQNTDQNSHQLAVAASEEQIAMMSH